MRYIVHTTYYSAIAAVALGTLLSVYFTGAILVNVRDSIRDDMRHEGINLAYLLPVGDVSTLRAEVERRVASPPRYQYEIVLRLNGNIIYDVHDISPTVLAKNMQHDDFSFFCIKLRCRYTLKVDTEDLFKVSEIDYDDVEIYVGLLMPTNGILNAIMIIGLGWMCFVFCGISLYKSYLNYRLKYEEQIAAINNHLDNLSSDNDSTLDEVRLAGSEIKALTDHINRMSKRLREQHWVLRKFTDVTAHELRTPLTRIKFKMEKLKAKASNGDDGIFFSIDNDVKETLMLFENIYTIAHTQMKTNRSNFEKYDLSELVYDLLEWNKMINNSIIFNYKGFEGQLILFGEKSLVRRCVENILENAIKYSKVGSIIELELTPLNDRFELSVINEPIDHIKLPASGELAFVERESETGLGLGLSLVQVIAARHGWQVRIESRDKRVKTIISGSRLAESGNVGE